MKTHVKRALDAAIDELKRDGYMALIMLCDRKDDKKLGDGLEVLCSETNNPQILREWALNALKEIAGIELTEEPKRLVH